MSVSTKSLVKSITELSASNQTYYLTHIFILSKLATPIRQLPRKKAKEKLTKKQLTTN